MRRNQYTHPKQQEFNQEDYDKVWGNEEDVEEKKFQKKIKELPAGFPRDQKPRGYPSKDPKNIIFKFKENRK